MAEIPLAIRYGAGIAEATASEEPGQVFALESEKIASYLQGLGMLFPRTTVGISAAWTQHLAVVNVFWYQQNDSEKSITAIANLCGNPDHRIIDNADGRLLTVLPGRTMELIELIWTEVQIATNPQPGHNNRV